MNRDTFSKLVMARQDVENVEMIEIASPEEVMENEDNLPTDLALLSLRNTVLFPGIVIPVTVTRQKFIKMVKKAYRTDRTVGVVAQIRHTANDPTPEDLFKVGTIAHILKMIVLPDGNVTIIIQGRRRFDVLEYTQTEPHLMANVKYISENFPNTRKKETKALIQSLKEAAYKILNLNPDIPRDAQMAISNIDSPSFLTHFLSSNLNIEISEKQLLLELLMVASKLIGYSNT